LPAGSAPPTTRSPSGEPELTTKRGFRPDIEGLRAIAILLVVAYHAGIPFLPGGFVGVDIFFVISGFLITGLLVSELDRTGRVSISGFYARRVRRLLPAIVLMVLAVAVLCWLVLPPLRRQDTGGDVVATGLFYANWHFAQQAVDYLASQQDPSPFLHMWSLSVEEQFYLAWPLLLVGLFALGRKMKNSRTPLLAGMCGVIVLSLLLSWQQTQSAAGLAYFSSLTRAWELALGGLIALLGPKLAHTPRAAAGGLGAVGLAAMLGAAVFFNGDTHYPGLAALLPTLGAAALLAAGFATAGSPVGQLVAVGPMRQIGRVSYGWYLWHWPLLVLAAAWTGSELSPVAGIVIVAVAYGLATLSLHYVENPFRRSHTLTRFPRRALLVGVVCTALVVSTGLVMRYGTRDSVLPPSEALGATVLAPVLPSKPGAAATPYVPPPIQTSATAVIPDPSNAREDLPALYSNGCHRSFADTSAGGCVFGDPQGTKTVFMFGDSHAAQWFPAMEILANQNHWRLIAITKSGCPAAAMEPYNGTIKRGYSECSTWRQNILARIAQEKPNLVFTVSINGYSLNNNDQPVTGSVAQKAQTQGWIQTIHSLLATGTQVAFLRDTPDMGEDVASCVSANMSHLALCAVPRAKAIEAGQSDELAQAQLGPVMGVHYLDINREVCPGALCPAVIGNVLVYRDKDHLTATYVTTLVKAMGALIIPLVK
jgi:peptidoglycan/LPS O-acetylase OafA/YrhL